MRYAIGSHSPSVGNAEVQPTTCIKERRMPIVKQVVWIMLLMLSVLFERKKQRKIYAG